MLRSRDRWTVDKQSDKMSDNEVLEGKGKKRSITKAVRKNEAKWLG